MMEIDKVLYKLSNSKFRSSFHLKEKDKKYADDFISKRLVPSNIYNDGHQTPMKGHPVFIAQHATATCCRNCLYKWHKIPKNIEINETQKEYIINIIMKWIEKEL